MGKRLQKNEVIVSHAALSINWSCVTRPCYEVKIPPMQKTKLCFLQCRKRIEGKAKITLGIELLPGWFISTVNKMRLMLLQELPPILPLILLKTLLR